MTDPALLLAITILGLAAYALGKLVYEGSAAALSWLLFGRGRWWSSDVTGDYSDLDDDQLDYVVKTALLERRERRLRRGD